MFKEIKKARLTRPRLRLRLQLRSTPGTCPEPQIGHPPAGSGSVPPQSRGLEPGKTLPSCPGYSQATPELSVVSVTETTYLSSDRTSAEIGNPNGTNPTTPTRLVVGPQTKFLVPEFYSEDCTEVSNTLVLRRTLNER